MTIKHLSASTAPTIVARRFTRSDTLRSARALADSQTPRDRRHLELTANDARARVRADYFELPGLTLTVAQAARLWSVGHDLALTVLEDLRSAGFLVLRNDQYARP